jgi:hypothetical protein
VTIAQRNVNALNVKKRFAINILSNAFCVPRDHARQRAALMSLEFAKCANTRSAKITLKRTRNSTSKRSMALNA